MNVKVETMCSYKIAYIRRIGEYGDDNKIQMEQLKRWASDNNLLDDDSVILGIAHDDPSRVAPQACRYDVCIVVPKEFKSNEIKTSEITGGKYVVFEIEHTATAVQKAWLDIFQEMPNLGYRLDETRPIIERYQVKMVNNHLCEICIPIH